MNINFGLLPPLAEPLRAGDGRRLRGPEKGLARKRALCARALADLGRWSDGEHPAAAAE
jgi:methylenetetrahydrofolate--tRNA-(uracil-5-)-methyltransferase